MLTDEQLAVRARTDTRALEQLFARFDGFVAMLTHGFFDPAAGRDDVQQEARLAVWYAARDYRSDGGSAFKTFLALVVRRHLIDYTKAATRPKHLILTHSVRVGADEDGGEYDAVDLLIAPVGDPVELLARRDEIATVVQVVNERLSPLERTALLGYLDGETMRVTQLRLGLPLCKTSLDQRGQPRPKVVENAISRAQAKIRHALAEAA